MKKLLLVLLFVPLVSFGQEEENVNITFENTTSNPVGGFNSARMKEWKNMRARRLQKYIYNPSKKTAEKLFRANKVIGLPLDADISQEHMKKWFPNIDLSKKVLIEKIITRDEAIKRIKEAKDLFDTGILNQEEYDKLVAKYKVIIMAN